MDNSLATYDASGNALGYFIYNENGAEWQSIPKSGTTPDNNLTTDLSDASPSPNPIYSAFLTNFMNELDSDSAQQFFLAINNINQYLLDGGIQVNPTLAVLRGKPLVLVQVTLQLETYGNTPVQIDASQFNTDINNLREDAYTYSTRNAMIEDVVIPVMMGNDGYLFDGLVGYFIVQPNDSDYSQTFETFYSANEISSASKIQMAATSTIQLSQTNPNVSLILVMDPRAPVHATTGVLPQQFLKLPESEYQKAMQNLAVYFTVTPILFGTTTSGGVTTPNYKFPVPTEQGYNWSWVQPSLSDDVPVTRNPFNDTPNWGIYPLQLQEGWLKMSNDED